MVLFKPGTKKLHLKCVCVSVVYLNRVSVCLRRGEVTHFNFSLHYFETSACLLCLVSSINLSLLSIILHPEYPCISYQLSYFPLKFFRIPDPLWETLSV